ncbi:hypothetical protein [Streptomyces sp. NBC_01187]|uniref:hypothetical protein n=1 Tax=Streptomyces sp. NBC_01187 TaxID=2903766 RepID=UPI0038692EB0|nr:hypothetical protein OG220_32100 [Streptomyces sp. NBC_01187]
MRRAPTGRGGESAVRGGARATSTGPGPPAAAPTPAPAEQERAGEGADDEGADGGAVDGTEGSGDGDVCDVGDEGDTEAEVEGRSGRCPVRSVIY